MNVVDKILWDLILRFQSDILYCNSPQATEPGPRLNIKTVLSTYGDFHIKDKTVVRTSYL